MRRVVSVLAATLLVSACEGDGLASPTAAPATVSSTTAPSVATTPTTEPPLPSTTVAATAPELAPAAAPPTRRSFTIAASGDVLIHEAIAAAARTTDGYDFTPLLSRIEPWIEPADLAICHLEGTLSPTNTGLLYQVEHAHPARFNAPREVADALVAAGYDACSTAGNHALDRGFEGITETLDVLDNSGLDHAGTARTPVERRPTLYQVAGVTVGHISVTIGTNVAGSPDRVWAVNGIDTEVIGDDVRWAREQGASFVILSLHWGVEYQTRPTAGQVDLAEELLTSTDIDLILGHHAHVVQPIDRIGDKVVVYGMGNHISNIRGLPDGSKNGGEDGVIVHLEVTEQADGRFVIGEVRFTPTWVDPVTMEVVPVAAALDEGSINRRALEASWRRTLDRVALLRPGAAVPTPVPWPPLVKRQAQAEVRLPRGS